MLGRRLIICPRCNTRVLASPYAVDIEHKCDSGNEVLDNEDIQRLGDYTDDDGNSVKVINPFLQGIGNALEGTRAGIEGERVDPLTRRGVRSSTHRTRQHHEFIVLKDKGGT